MRESRFEIHFKRMEFAAATLFDIVPAFCYFILLKLNELYFFRLAI